ncbi:type I modular polyketide synthase [Chryseobacterium sp. StRB126]|uniref:hypothetical protein n=1 Tax=Chryseobacterium sp. StRB126 TaxID=878220 RepID=UPI0004E983A4|nr:hypothetical protein [Chryseobacterium sp. StRB126]BAP30965.1 type I modular polyketide synthase [Chryseobacterium sp. StRB126]
MDIVKHISQHSRNLIDGLMHSSLEQRKNLTIALLGFYSQLPNFKETLHQYLHINIKKRQLISDIRTGHLQNYVDAIEISNAEADVYADNYEEPEPIELLILYAFAGITSDLKFSAPLVPLLIGIIDTLDYYENLSDRPEFWHQLLEKEVQFQNEILIQLRSEQTFHASIYEKRYEHVEFTHL